ncbi:hypothetical protein B0H13DRAFT_1909393 [Mycena leptocephala]|nr:hypothetical protein B0H13DRAFT_1909393 [Mycena leptocephala]
MPRQSNTLPPRCLGRWGILLDTARDSAARNSPHTNIDEDDFRSVIPPSQATDPAVVFSAYNPSRSLYPHIPELYPSEDEDEGLEYMKGTDHPPNECDRSGIDDALELAPGDSSPGVNGFVADPNWEPPLVAGPATRIGCKHCVYEWIPTYNWGKPLT